MRNLCALADEVCVPTVLPIAAWRCDCRARGRLVVNGALDFERLEDMQRGDVMHGVSLEDEPFHGLCCRAGQGRIIFFYL